MVSSKQERDMAMRPLVKPSVAQTIQQYGHNYVHDGRDFTLNVSIPTDLMLGPEIPYESNGTIVREGEYDR
jgi:hypothetical protein